MTGRQAADASHVEYVCKMARLIFGETAADETVEAFLRVDYHHPERAHCSVDVEDGLL